MTREEARKYLIQPVATSTEPSKEYLKQKEAYDMAILALYDPPYDDAVSKNELKKAYKERFISNLKDDKRGIDLSQYAEEPCRIFNEFIDSLPVIWI